MTTAPRDVSIRTEALLGTFVTIQVVGRASRAGDPHQTLEHQDAIERALEWFRQVERCCSRFDPQSEVMRLAAQVGAWVPVSDMLFEVVAFALAVAEDTAGAFDPTVGHDMEAHGFNREHRTGRVVSTGLAPDRSVSYRDVHLDLERKAIRLDRALILDLGAVAKGLAVDMAALELEPFRDFAIDAGGDLFLAGHNRLGQPWTIGIRHPRLDRQLIDSIVVSDVAVCTSGDYERTSARDNGHHILDPRTRTSATGVASVTVVAPSAMLADALATSAFVLGPVEGRRLLERQGVEGLFVTPTLDRHATKGFHSCVRQGHETHATG